MNDVKIEIDDVRSLTVRSRDHKLHLNSVSCGLLLELALSPAQAHLLLEAVSQFLSETP